MIRVTQDHLYFQLLNGIRSQQAALVHDQEQISSGKKLNRPSDDPVGASRASTLHVRTAALDRFRAAVNDGTDRLNETGSALQDLSDLLTQAKEISVQAKNGTLNDADRENLAKRVDAMITKAIEVANRRDAQGFLFAGTANATPFTPTAAGGATYQGDGGTNVVEMQDYLKLATNIPGATVFMSQARGKTEFFGGNTGVKAGTGTDSGMNRGTLSVTHGATTYGNGALAGGGDSVSGVVPASTSAAQDTVIGPAGSNTLHIDAVNKTVSLNGGAAVSYTGTETDLSVVDANGATVHVNVTGVTAGFQGDVSIASTGFLSTDGGATKTAIDFSANQTIVDSKTGATTNVDSSGIRRAGTETVDYVGTTDLFSALDGLRDDLRNTSLTDSQRSAALNSRLREVGRNHENVLSNIADVGSRSKLLEDVGTRLDGNKAEIQKLLSTIEDADYAEVVTHLNQTQLTLQLAEAAGSKILQTRLFDFLQ